MLKVSRTIFRPNHLCRTYATVLMDGRGTFERNFNWKMKFCIGDFPGFSCPTEAVNFNFPNVVFSYNKQDAINHAISSGVEKEWLDKEVSKEGGTIPMLPSFYLPLTNKILLDWHPYVRGGKAASLHGELYAALIRPPPVQSLIEVRTELIDILDKGTGTIYCYHFHGRDADGPIFLYEYQFFEVGTGGRVTKKDNPSLKPIVDPPIETEPTETFEFTTIPVTTPPRADEGEKNLYSVDHPRQYYSQTNKFAPYPISDGRYTFAATVQGILKKYAPAGRDYSRCKRVKVRFAKPILPGDKILVQTWKRGARIHFQAVNADSKEVMLKGGYLDLDI